MPRDVSSRLDSDYGHSDVVVMDAPVTGSTLTLSALPSGPDMWYTFWAIHVSTSLISDLSTQSAFAADTIIVNVPSSASFVLNQALRGVHIVAAAEIVGLAAVTALDTKRFFQYVTGPGAELGRKQDCWSWMFEDCVPRMLDDELPQGFAMRTVIRDVRIVNDEAERFGAQLSLCKESQFVYEEAVEMGGSRMPTIVLC